MGLRVCGLAICLTRHNDNNQGSTSMKLLNLLCAACLLVSSQVRADQEFILVQSTTSTQNSGLYDYLLPQFQDATGIRVDVVAVGTGQAIRNAQNGDADVLLVHAKAAEETFVAEGYGVERFDLMYNDFVVIGPLADPAGIASQPLSKALALLADGSSPFVSRGDDSGTHKKERALWSDADLAPQGSWYRETGSGMGATIRMAVEMDGYTLTDRATWIAFGDKGTHRIVVEGDPALFNQYGVIAVNPDKHPHANIEGANRFIDWLLGADGQAAIGAYKVQGQQLFYPNASGS